MFYLFKNNLILLIILLLYNYFLINNGVHTLNNNTSSIIDPSNETSIIIDSKNQIIDPIITDINNPLINVTKCSDDTCGGRGVCKIDEDDFHVYCECYKQYYEGEIDFSLIFLSTHW